MRLGALRQHAAAPVGVVELLAHVRRRAAGIVGPMRTRGHEARLLR